MLKSRLTTIRELISSLDKDLRRAIDAQYDKDEFYIPTHDDTNLMHALAVAHDSISGAFNYTAFSILRESK